MVEQAKTAPASRPQLLTVSEFAAHRQCSEKTVRRRIKEGVLPVIRTGRSVRIHPRFLDIDL